MVRVHRSKLGTNQEHDKMGMQCDCCGKRCGTGPSDHVHELWQLKPDTRSSVKKVLFDRKPSEYGGDYEKMWVCNECAGRLRSQGWEQHWEGED